MPVKLIALDIDGTLLDSRWKLPEANRAAIQEATRRGIEVALVTGRRYDFALPVAQDLGVAVTLIVNNGGLIRSNDGQTRLKHLLSSDVSPAGLQFAAPPRGGGAGVFFSPRAKPPILGR